MKTARSILVLLAGLGPATGLLAQTPESLARPLIPIHTAAADEAGGSYGIWAAGPGYKVGFEGSMTFVPLLGRTAASQSLTWQTTSIRVGEHELLTGRSPAGRRAGAFRYEYDLGSVIEAYDVRAEGLEQTFVLAERPAGSGDLVVTGAIGGSVTAPQRPRGHTALTMRGSDGRPVISYGAATAIDAAGNSYPMDTTVTEGRIELRLDGTALAVAEFPLVVDPLLSNVIVSTGDDIESVDVLYDHQEQNNDLWICYSLYASATDRDVVVRRFEDDFSGTGTTVYADLSSQWNSTEPQITGVGGVGNGQTITVFTRQFAGGLRRVRWHRHDKMSMTLSTFISSAPFQGGQEWRPDVGGTHGTSFGAVAMIVYQVEPGSPFANGPQSELHGLTVDTETGQVTGPFPVGFAGGNLDQERPSISQIAGGGIFHSWVVAWQSFDNAAGGPWQIGARRFGRGSATNGLPVLLPTGTDHAIAPKVAGMQGTFLVAYGERPPQTFKPQAAEGRALRTQWVDWHNTTALPVTPAGERTLHTRPSDVLVASGIAFDFKSRSHWAVTCHDSTQANERLLIDKVGYDGSSVEGGEIYRTPGWLPTNGAVTFNDSATRYSIVFAALSATGPGPLFGAHMIYNQAAPPTEYGTACGLNATQSHTGEQRIGSQIESFDLHSTLTVTPTFCAISIAPAALPLGPWGMTGCELLVDGGPGLVGTRLYFTDTNGRASHEMALPSGLPELDIHTQWFPLVPGINPAGVATSRGMVTQFVH